MKMSTILTDYILKKGLIQKEDYEIYQYGFETFLEIFINVICSILIAVILDMTLECVIFFFFFIPLRSYSGGLHMEHYVTCLLLSCVTLTGVLLLVKYYTLKPILSFLLFLMAFVIIRVIGPVDHPNRTVDAEENSCFQKRTDYTLIVSFVLAAAFLATNCRKCLFLEALVYLLVSFTSLIGISYQMKNTRK